MSSLGRFYSDIFAVVVMEWCDWVLLEMILYMSYLLSRSELKGVESNEYHSEFMTKIAA